LSHCSNQRVRDRDKSLDPHERQEGVSSEEAVSFWDISVEAQSGASAGNRMCRRRESFMVPDVFPGGCTSRLLKPRRVLRCNYF
jgi:hypothetical protein